MREIKFRAYNIQRKDWDYFTLFQILNLQVGYSQQHDLNSWHEYTGLKDKNGMEIYEGDIILAYWWGTDKVVEWNPTIGIGPKPQIVRYEDNGFSPMAVCDREGEYGHENYDYLILGNIYENPELIP